MKSLVCFTIFFLSKCQAVDKNPNILFIVVDDLRPNIGVYGDPDAFTPNIDKLAKDGITFDGAYAQQALCAPSRNSFLTSRRPDTLHLYDFYNYWRTFAGNFTTLPQYFKENFYHTKSIGKIFHPGESSDFTDDYPISWSEVPWHPSTEKYKDSPVCYSNQEWSSNLVCPVKVKEQPEKSLPDIQSVHKAVKFIKSRRKGDQPFFLAVGLHKPHVPLKFPEQYLSNDHKNFHPIENVTLPGLRNYPPSLPTIAWNPWTDIRRRDDISKLNLTFPYEPFKDSWAKKIRQAYFSCVSYIDDLVGKLLLSLKVSKLHKNTIVVLLGDHGWSLGEHGEWSKYSNFDVAVRVPLILRIPNLTYFAKDRDSEEAHVQQVVELIDIFPTLVDLAGLEPIPKCPANSSNTTLCTEGSSMVPLILNSLDIRNSTSSEELKWKNFALSQYPRPGVTPTLSPNSDKPKLHQIRFMGYSFRNERYRYTQWIEWDPETLKGNWSNVNQTEFYDHHIDPDENLNLAGRPGLEDVEEMLSNLLRESFGY